jgi:hypothetical protein
VGPTAIAVPSYQLHLSRVVGRIHSTLRGLLALFSHDGIVGAYDASFWATRILA